MKIIYKVSIATKSDKFTAWYFFDTYQGVENWLEKHYDNPKILTRINIDTLMKCDDCDEYDNPMHYKFIKRNWNEINVYCVACAQNNIIDSSKYIKRKDDCDEE